MLDRGRRRERQKEGWQQVQPDAERLERGRERGRKPTATEPGKRDSEREQDDSRGDPGNLEPLGQPDDDRALDRQHSQRRRADPSLSEQASRDENTEPRSHHLRRRGKCRMRDRVAQAREEQHADTQGAEHGVLAKGPSLRPPARDRERRVDHGATEQRGIPLSIAREREELYRGNARDRRDRAEQGDPLVDDRDGVERTEFDAEQQRDR